jgi:hypothetical protein
MGKGGRSLGVVGSSPAEDMGKEGVHFIQADNSKKLGRLAVHKRLELNKKGESTVHIFKNLEHFWRTMPLLREDERNPEEIVSKNVEDHIYSVVRYFCMFRPSRPTTKPKPDTGSFQAERRKFIQAKRMATLRGIGLTEAYQKIR